MKKIALIMLGVGSQDGSEITETVSAMIALAEFEATVTVFSFNENFEVRNYDKKSILDSNNHNNIIQNRNALIESQRLTKNKTKDISDLNANNFDGLVIPGGDGFLINLTTYSKDGLNFKVHSLLEKIILKFQEQSKPIGAICISPLVVASILKKHNPSITLGENFKSISEIKKMNIQHEACPSIDYITDRDIKLLTTPAYMNDNVSPFQVHTGIRLMIKELVEMA